MPKGLVFPCPYCQHSIESPGSDITAADAAQYQQWAMRHGAAAASLADQQYRQQHDPANTVFASASTVLGTVVGGTPYFLGAMAAADGSWSIRLVDGLTRQMVWESLVGSRWSFPPDEQKVAFRDDRCFIAIEGALHCLDMASGRVLWTAQLPGEVETRSCLAGQGDELMLYDFALPSGEGAVAVVTKQGLIAAWGRDGGRPLWHQIWDSPSVHHVPGLGLILDNRETAAFVRAFDGATLAQWTGDELPEEIFVSGNRIALHMQVEVDGFDRDRVRIVDASTLQVIADHPVKDVDLDDAAAFVGPRLLAPIQTTAGSTYQVVDPAVEPKEPGFFARLFGRASGGAARRQLPVPKMRFEKILVAGGLVFFDMRDHEHDNRRLLALDANTLAPRYDSGPLSYEPSTMDDQQVQTDGRIAVYVTAPTGDDDQCELRAVDCGTGAPRWQLPIGSWSIHFVVGEHLVVHHHPPQQGATVSVLSLADGSVVARCPFV